MNKTELVEKIAANAGLTKDQAKAALNATTSALKDALIAGDKSSWQVSEHSALANVQLARVSTLQPRRRFRLLPRRLPSLRLALNLRMHSINNRKDYFHPHRVFLPDYSMNILP